MKNPRRTRKFRTHITSRTLLTGDELQDVAKALDNARPSLSAADRRAMEGRYDTFRKTREGQKVSPFSKESEAARRAMADSADSQKVALG